MKQEKTYGDSHAPNRSVPLCCPFFSTFFQKTPKDESLKTPMFSTCSEDFISFTFTGKEKDSLRLNLQSGELCGARLTSPPDLFTSYYYFGARYYDCDLSGLFLSVDPMADKYPSLSPYAYCAWNPVKLVDPEGKEIGDYYDINGKYLGWDGKKDDNVYIVTHQESINKIKSNSNNNQTTDTKEVTIAVSTNYFVPKQAENILNLTIADKGENEFSASMSGSLSTPIRKGKGKNGFMPSPLDQTYPLTSIHSHIFSDDKYDHWIEYMSSGEDKDSHNFQSYDLNIIVGQRCTGTGYGAAFFDRQPLGDESAHPPILTLTQESLQRISKWR